MRLMLIAVLCAAMASVGQAQTAAPATGTMQNPAKINIPQSPKFDPALPVVSAPKLIKHVEPEYPEYARKKKLSATVVVRMVVDEAGVPQNIAVIKPLGNGFDEATIAAVNQWRFEPAMRDGKPVAVSLQSEVTFRIY